MSDIQYQLKDDIPMFRGIVRKGTIVTIKNNYGVVLNVITDGGVEIHGLSTDRLETVPTEIMF